MLSNGALRLVNTGRSQFGGRLEVYYNNEWGTVCGDSWDYSDGTVACRQMGFVGVSDSSRFGFGVSSQRIWLDNVACNGSESRLIDCSHAGIGQRYHYCDHSNDVGIICIKGELTGFLYYVKPLYGEAISCLRICIYMYICMYCHE